MQHVDDNDLQDVAGTDTVIANLQEQIEELRSMLQQKPSDATSTVQDASTSTSSSSSMQDQVLMTMDIDQAMQHFQVAYPGAMILAISTNHNNPK